MQTLANISASREVLRQVEINNGAVARLEGYYANYKEALRFQLDQKKPDLLEALNPIGSVSPAASSSSLSPTTSRALNRRMPSGSFMAGPSSSSPPSSDMRPPSSSMALSPGAGPAAGSMRRRKSLRESIGGEQVMATVNTLATKVVSSNDR